MNHPITAPKGAKIHYLELKLPTITIIGTCCELLAELSAGQDCLFELRTVFAGKTSQSLWLCRWSLADFEHRLNTMSPGALQRVLLPWYLCVEYDTHKYALYQMDEGSHESTNGRQVQEYPSGF